MMKKRFLSVICLTAMLSFLVPSRLVLAETYDEEQAAEILLSLGIVEDEIYTKVTRDCFVESLSKFLYDSPELMGSPEYIARNLGVIDYTQEYRGSEIISTKEAVKYAVIALGYGITISDAADITEFVNIGSSLELTKGLSINDEQLSRSDSYRLLHNIMNAEPLEIAEMTLGDTTYQVAKGETLLSRNKKIYKVKGILTAIPETSIYREFGRNGYIKIDDTEYEAKDIDASELLGKNVFAYIEEDSDNVRVRYIGEQLGRNEEITICAEDVLSVNSDFSILSYIKDDTREKRVNLDAALKVILNGRFFGSYTTSDFKPDFGDIRLLDTNSDRKYDIAFINDYDTVIVEGIAAHDMKVYGKYSHQNAVSLIDFEEDAETSFNRIYKDGQEIAISEIKQGDVLSVLISRNEGDKLITAYVSDKSVGGTIGAMDLSEMLVSIDGNEYSLLQSFLDDLASENKSIKLSDTGTFFLDAFGNIAAFRRTLTQNYAIALRVWLDENDIGNITYMDMEEEVYKQPLAKKVRYNGTSMKRDDLYNSIAGMKPQVVKITTNSAGEIKELQTAKLSSTYEENQLTVTAQQTYDYRANMKGFDNKFYIENGAKIALFPVAESRYAYDYAIVNAASYFRGDTPYTFTAYDVDDFGFSDLFSIKQTNDMIKTAINRSMFVVTSVSHTCVDDEIVSRIKGSMGIYQDFTLLGEAADTFDNVKKGDVLNVSVNKDGRVNYFEKIYSLNSDFVMNDATTLYQNYAMISGTVDDIEREGNRIKINSGGAQPKSFRFDSGMNVRRYSKTDNTCEIISVAELKKTDKVLVRVSWGMPAEIIVIE